MYRRKICGGKRKRANNRKFGRKKIESAEAWLEEEGHNDFFSRTGHVSAARGRATLATIDLRRGKHGARSRQK